MRPGPCSRSRIATVAPPHLYLAACAMMTSAPAAALEFLRRATTLADLQQAASCHRTPRCNRTSSERDLRGRRQQLYFLSPITGTELVGRAV
ncbi:hypothetical protein MTO96_008445 [Rhipicephalus appendiculatus]